MAVPIANRSSDSFEKVPWQEMSEIDTLRLFGHVPKNRFF
jgi:hypothetical protein